MQRKGLGCPTDLLTCILITFNHVCVCLCLELYALHVCAHRGQKRKPDSMELELKVFGGHSMLLLELNVDPCL